MSREAGKGSQPRPKEVDHNTFADNWDRIFKKTPDEKPVDDVVDSGDNSVVNPDSF